MPTDDDGPDPDAMDAPLTGTKVERRAENERHIRASLNELTGGPPDVKDLHHHHEQHNLGAPRLSIGGSNVLDAGRYYQVCFTCGNKPVWITKRLDRELLLGSQPLAGYLALRHELAPTPRSKKADAQAVTPRSKEAHTEARATASVLHLSSNASPLSTIQSSSSDGALAVPAGSQISSPTSISAFPKPPRTLSHVDDMLDKSLPVTVMVWIKNGCPPIQVLAYPRYTRRLRLDDHKIPLGAEGFEAGSLIETFLPLTRRWTPIRWDTPRLIESAGEVLLIRVATVTNLANWEDHELFIIDKVPSSPLMDSSPLAKKRRL